MKSMQLWRLPNILIVHLKRFECKHSFRREKIESFVDCPLTGLDLQSYCATNILTNHTFINCDTPAIYDLFAVTNHHGRMGFGHYTAAARRWDEIGMEKEWALFDDSSVSVVRSDAIITPAAYVLFYRRRNISNL
jgi:ubiquitin C-terminal hydrolase